MQSIKREIMDWLKSIVVATLMILLMFSFARPSWVVGPSMEKTMKEGDLLLVQSISYVFSEPRRGDIVVVNSHQQIGNIDNANIVKRVIGLPGEHIIIDHGHVYIDDQLLKEPYLHGDNTPSSGDWLVPKGHVFIMGDNRAHSSDSRDRFGYIAIDDIKGRVYWRIYPFSKFGTIY